MSEKKIFEKKSSVLFSQNITKLKKKKKNMEQEKDIALKKFCCKIMFITI